MKLSKKLWLILTLVFGLTLAPNTTYAQEVQSTVESEMIATASENEQTVTENTIVIEPAVEQETVEEALIETNPVTTEPQLENAPPIEETTTSEETTRVETTAEEATVEETTEAQTTTESMTTEDITETTISEETTTEETTTEETKVEENDSEEALISEIAEFGEASLTEEEFNNLVENNATFASLRAANNNGAISFGTFIGRVYYTHGGISWWDDMYVMKIGDKYVFCIEPLTTYDSNTIYTSRPFNENGEYLQNSAISNNGVTLGSRPINLTPEMQKQIEKIYKYSFEDNISNLSLATRYQFTNFMIWETIGVTGLPQTGGYAQHKAKVLEAINKYHNTPSFDVLYGTDGYANVTHNIKVGQTLTFVDQWNILNKLNIPNSLNGFNLSVSGNTLSITATKDAVSGELRFMQDSNSSGDGVSLIYKAPNRQSLGSFVLNDPVLGALKLLVAPNLGSIELNKTTSEGNVLANVEFELLKDNKVVATKKTDEYGKILFTDLEEGNYSIREKSTPLGYVKNTEVKVVAVVPEQKASVSFVNQVQKGRLTIVKTDKEDSKPIAGAVFQLTDANGKVYTLTTDSNGKAYTDNLPLGKYTLKEVKAPNGYQLDNTVHTVELTSTDNTTPLFEVVKNLVNSVIPPTIQTNASNKVDGLQVIDPLETITIQDAITFKDLIIGREYNVSGVLMDKATNKPLLVDGKEVRSALKFIADTVNGTKYLDFTFKGSALKGKEVVVFEDLYYNNKVVASHADINDKNQTVRFTNPKIQTTATNKADGLQVIDPLESITIKDVVSYTDLIVGKTYNISGVLMDKATNKPLLVDGKEIRSNLTFVADKTNGSVSLDFILKALNLKGKEVVVFEDLLRDDLKLYAHADINDKNQTVRFTNPKIQTSASNKADGLQVIDPLESITIKDVVSYTDLIVGKTYNISGVLMDKATNKPLLVDGKEIRSNLTFVADKTNGSVSLDFILKALNLKGKEVVVFEDLLRDDLKLYAHADINDKNQTVRFTNPKIQTTATNKADGLQVIDPLESITIKDVVSYTDLIVGKTYNISGVLMDKATNKPLLVDGKEIRSNLTFVADKTNGSVSLDFILKALNLKGKEVVVFEDLLRDDLKLYAHADINDKNQTVRFTNPKIQTTATNNVDGTKELEPLTESTVKDVVSYTDLIVGKTYNISGILMDKETNKPILVDGKEIRSNLTFVAETTNGTVELLFNLNATGLRDKHIVVFEDLLRDNLNLYSHADINDEDQTVRVMNPRISTTAKFEDGSKVIYAYVNGKAVIIDTVQFWDLKTNKDYRLTGYLMDKATGELLLINNESVMNQLVFRPETADGTIDLPLEIKDTTYLGGKYVVVFEELDSIIGEDEEGELIVERVAEHKDINDEGQTVKFEYPPQPELPNKPELPNTGEASTFNFVYGSILLIAGAMIIFSTKKRNY